MKSLPKPVNVSHTKACLTFSLCFVSSYLRCVCVCVCVRVPARKRVGLSECMYVCVRVF